MYQSEISLLSHASIMINAGGKKILTDPWYFGTAFNDGWELSPKPNLEEIQAKVKDVDFIWVSHEHPDHLHFPTLKWLTEFIKEDVTILFQKNNSSKVFEALEKLGYRNFVSMNHLEKIKISSCLQVACYAHRHLDSALAVFVDDEFWLLNINDTELTQSDIAIIKRKFGTPSVLYNQFSIAGSDGIREYLEKDSTTVLQKLAEHHKTLSANITVPFASFVKFARHDNAYMNRYANTVMEAKEIFAKENLRLCLQSFDGKHSLVWRQLNLLPQNWEVVNSESESFYANYHDHENDKHNYELISESELKEVVESRIANWRQATNPIIWKLLKLKSISFEVVDQKNKIWICDLEKGTFVETKNVDEADIKIASQPLWQAFKMPFGIQTLGVSGRYQFSSKHNQVPSSWKKIRIVSSLYNAEVYLSLSSVFSSSTLSWIWQRRNGILGQIAQQFKRFMVK